MVAIGLAGMTTLPSETGTLRTRPAPGARTAPSAACCSTPRGPNGAPGGYAPRRRAGSSPDRTGPTRADAAAAQLLRALEIGLRLITVGLLRLNARLQRLHLQQQLRSATTAMRSPAATLSPSFTSARRSCRRSAPARRFMHRLDGRDHGFAVIDDLRASPSIRRHGPASRPA